MFDALGPLLLVVIWIIRQVYTAIQDQKEAEAAKQANAQREAALAGAGDNPVPGRPGQAQAKAAPDNVRSEVDEFLRQIGQARNQPAAGPREKPDGPPRRRGPIDPFEEPPRRRPQPRPAARVQRPPAEPEIELLVGVDEPPPQREPTKKPTAPPTTKRKELRRLPESQLAEQSATLGQRIAASDDRLEERLHQKFDHSLGKLSADKAGVADNKPVEEPITGAARIRAMLSGPGGMRDAVILSEIIRRPGDQL